MLRTFEERWLTPQLREEWDPYGRLAEKVDKLKRAQESYARPSRIFRSHDEIFDRYTKILEKLTWPKAAASYLEYNCEMFSKTGRQGGTVPWTEIEPLFKSYYEVPVLTDLPKDLYVGRDRLLAIIKYRLRNVCPPDVERYDRGIIGTYAGCPTGKKKGDFLAETEGMQPFRHVKPALPGVRRYRSKIRTIFMDANPNVRYIERQLTSVRDWLKYNLPEFFGSWLPPHLYQDPAITRGLQLGLESVETDYQSMDTHFTRTIVTELILPIYELLIPSYFLSFASFVEELFEQPLFMGDYYWTGLHSLFSGQGITNDFETIYTIILQLGVMTCSHYAGLSAHFALGDDSLLMAEKGNGRRLMDRMIDVSGQANMIIHDDEKSRVVLGEARYLRRVYAPQLTSTSSNVLSGWYPSVLAVNNILYPEHPHDDIAIEIAAMYSRLDNLQYNKIERCAICDLLASRAVVDISCPSETLPSDWWERLYGEKWNPSSSPSFNYVTYRHGYKPRTVPDFDLKSITFDHRKLF